MTRLTDTPAWVRDAVFYQIFPDRFAASARVVKPGPLEPWDAPPTYHGYKGGDLLGIVERLDYLTDLGITALYLTPVFSSASNHRYHTYDYFHVDPLLGGDDALRELLDACHARDMRVVLDGVFNHSGRGFWPFHHAVENGIGSPYLDWFYVDRERLAHDGWLKPYPSAAEREQIDEAKAGGLPPGEASLRVLGYKAWWDLPALPKLNTDNPQMREHLLEAAEYWIRFGIDGWRLDVAEEIDADFWREFRRRVRAINPQAYIVAEIWREKPQWLTGDTFDALMNYPLTEAILSFVGGPMLDMEVVVTQHEYRQFVRPIDGATFGAALEHLLERAYRPAAKSVQLNLLGSHDTARFLTVAGGDKASLRLATLVQMTVPGAPCIYYGDEIGMEGRHDPDCRRAFPRDEGDWDDSLRAFIRAAIRVRREQPATREGTFRLLAAAGDAVCYALEETGSPTVVVALNAGTAAAALSFPAPGALEAADPLLAGSVGVRRDDGAMVTVEIEPRSGGVFIGG